MKTLLTNPNDLIGKRISEIFFFHDEFPISIHFEDNTAFIIDVEHGYDGEHMVDFEGIITYLSEQEKHKLITRREREQFEEKEALERNIHIITGDEGSCTDDSVLIDPYL